MPPKPEAAATAPNRTLASEASSHLVQLSLAGLLAAISWFLAVEQPKLAQVGGLIRNVQLLQQRTEDLQAQLDITVQEIARVEKASPAGLQASSMQVFQREYEERIVGVRTIVEDVQRQVALERKQREEHREHDRDIVGQLSQHLKWLDKQVHTVREEMDSASRLERANALLEGRLPSDFLRPAGGGAHESGEMGQARSTQQGESKPAAEAEAQPATGGLVELRDGDFSKLLRDGDSWVVMFYAPWCGHCTAAAPVFQQAALQAPVHFARIDAAAHPEVAQSEGISGFPTIRFYSKGKVVRCEVCVHISCTLYLMRSMLTPSIQNRTQDGERTVRELLDFARGENCTAEIGFACKIHNTNAVSSGDNDFERDIDPRYTNIVRMNNGLLLNVYACT
jgi:thiol-disulfide isomerase/thioredoxin